MNPSNEPGSEFDPLCVEIGERLRAARKASKLSRAEVAQRLKVTAWIIDGLESGAWSRLGPSVYGRGYLRQYGRLVEVDTQEGEGYFQRQQEPAPMVVMPAPRRSQWLPYQRLVTYVAATALVAVPAIWLARSILNQPIIEQWVNDPEPTVASIPLAEVASRDANEGPVEPTDPIEPVFVDAEPIAPPVKASMTSLPASDHSEDATEDGLVLRLDEDAWLEVEDYQSERLAFGLMKAGSTHRFPVDNGLRLRIGNAGAVEASLDGQPYDLEPYTDRELAKLEIPPRESDDS